jgi:hypothetical protein
MGVFFIISDQTLGDSTINETNAHRGIIDASANKLISFLIGKFVHPLWLTFDIARPTMIPWDRSKQELAREQ